MPAEFEKDDDTNFHIDFIHSFSNIRARNYRIDACDKLKSKMIAGRIIPAIATTTSMVCGCVASEIYKFVQGFKTRDLYRHGFYNLALNFYMFVKPPATLKKKDKFDVSLNEDVKMIKPDNKNFQTAFDKIVV